MTLRYMKHAPEAYLDQDASAIAAHMSGAGDREAEARVEAARAPSNRREGTDGTFWGRRRGVARTGRTGRTEPDGGARERGGKRTEADSSGRSRNDPQALMSPLL